MPSDWNVPLAPYVVHSCYSNGFSFETRNEAIAFIAHHYPDDPTAHVTCFGDVVWPERDDNLSELIEENDEP